MSLLIHICLTASLCPRLSVIIQHLKIGVWKEMFTHNISEKNRNLTIMSRFAKSLKVLVVIKKLHKQ